MTLRLSARHPNRLYEMVDDGRLNQRSDQMSVSGTGARNYYQAGDVLFRWEYNLEQLALQFTEFRGNLDRDRDDFTIVDFMISALDLDEFVVVGILEPFRHSDDSYPFKYAMQTGSLQWSTLTRRSQNSYTLRGLESAMEMSRLARGMLIWEDVGRIVMEGSMSIFTGPGRAAVRVAVRSLTRSAFRRVVKHMMKRVGPRLVRIVVQSLLSTLGRLTLAIAANITGKIGVLCFRSEMRNRMAANNPQLRINQQDLWQSVRSVLPNLVRTAVAEEVSGLFTDALSGLLPGATPGQAEAVFGDLETSFTRDFSNALAEGIFSLLGSILESFIMGVSIGSGEDKERFEQRVGRHLQQEIESLMTADAVAEIANATMSRVVSNLEVSIQIS